MSHPKIMNITHQSGIAGQYQFTVIVQYPDEPASPVRFVGSVYGGTVTMIGKGGQQVRVSDPDRFGPRVTEQWVQNFFGGGDA